MKGSEPVRPTTASRRLRLWLFYHYPFHYRLPFWDLLIDRGRDRFDLTIFGETENGNAVGGGSRPYLRHMPIKGGLFSAGYTWVGAVDMIRREQPELIMIQPDPRARLSWQVPGLVQPYGGVCIAWAKVHSTILTLLPEPILRLLKRRLLLHYDLALTYGHQSTEELVSLGFPRARAYTTQNTIDTRRIFTDADALQQRGRQLRDQHGLTNRKILLCIAKMDPRKRHHDLLAAWPRLRDLDPGLVLVLGGRGPLIERIRAQARRIDPDRIIFLGSLPEGDDYGWIATADMTIQCGAIGLAINQSMAAGTPTIIADESGADSEIVSHGVTGWRYPKGDVDRLVQTVNHVLTDPGERERIVAEARRFVRNEASIAKMTDVAAACLGAAIDLWDMRNPAK